MKRSKLSCGLRRICRLTLISVALDAGAAGYDNEPVTVRGLAWGEEAWDEMQIVGSDDRTIRYRKPNEHLWLGDAELLDVTYAFHITQGLYAIEMQAKEGCRAAMSSLMTTFGALPTIFSKTGMQWVGGITTIQFSLEPTHCLIGFHSSKRKPIVDKEIEDAQRAASKSKSDDLINRTLRDLR